ncbi:beta-lactamase family protein [candidate division KSB1 bacterium]|nr:beta-lactamase family protein [candidate division KSB1 bacterium]
MKKTSPFMIALFTLFVLSQFLFGQGLPSAVPEEVGMSSLRFERLRPFMQSYVDEHKLSGLVTIVARRGKVVHFEKYGKQDESQPMQFDTIFRIASMTKPVTSVAIMMLYEEGRFQLSDPVSKYIPEFKNTKVFVGKEKGVIKLEDPKNPLIIRDLLTHTSGLTYGFFDRTPVDSMYIAADLFNGTFEEFIKKLAIIPFKHQPGTKWEYSVSADVLGYLIQKISGVPFEEFLEQRIFKPLKMKDTGFYLPEKKMTRFAALYGRADTGGLKVIEEAEKSRFKNPPGMPSGGGGLVSTVFDYMRFCQMLLNRGELEGTRILGRRTVEFMTKNHLPEEQCPVFNWMPGIGFGLGFSVCYDITEAKIIGSEGEYGWGGIYNTFFWIDPEEELILILMTQFDPFLYYPVNNEFKVLVYQAIIE